jgi:hypothetical protein
MEMVFPKNMNTFLIPNLYPFNILRLKIFYFVTTLPLGL